MEDIGSEDMEYNIRVIPSGSAMEDIENNIRMIPLGSAMEDIENNIRVIPSGSAMEDIENKNQRRPVCMSAMESMEYKNQRIPVRMSAMESMEYNIRVISSGSEMDDIENNIRVIPSGSAMEYIENNTWEIPSGSAMECIENNILEIPLGSAMEDIENTISGSLMEDIVNKYAFSKKCCIYRVPERLRSLNEKSYTPRVVSLGPFHHGEENLKAMEDNKKLYLQQFLHWSKGKVSEEDLIDIIMKREKELRDCYAETIQPIPEVFPRMILMDAVFIIMVLLILKDLEKPFGRQLICFEPWKLVDIVFDICLLENQLPFFILEELFAKLDAKKLDVAKCTIYELTSGFLKKQWKKWVKEDGWKKIKSSKSEVLHFVDFLRKCQHPPAKQETSSAATANELVQGEVKRPPAKQETLSAPTATELHQAGVKFDTDESENLLSGIYFSEGILHIPQLIIDDRTEILWRNLQAFEQCHHLGGDTFVSDYITFITCLVDAPNDVEVLVDKIFLKNMLRSKKAVPILLYNLDKENRVSKHAFLSDVCDNLNQHCGKPWNKQMATLKQVYFKNTWTGISVIAACVLLVLTFIQTVCSVLQVR